MSCEEWPRELGFKGVSSLSKTPREEVVGRWRLVSAAVAAVRGQEDTALS